MLAISNAGVDYAGHIAFEHFTLSVEQGSTVSVLGKSGCGKTSLLYAIAGLTPLAEGAIQIEGGRDSCGIMFQEDRLLPWKRVIDNVLLGLPQSYRTSAEELLELMGLQSVHRKYPHQLSGGMRQRVALARALVRKPRLLLLDEPLASLDEQQREQLQDEIKRYVAAHGITVLLVTHSIREAVYMGSRIIVMTPKGISFSLYNDNYLDEDLRSKDALFQMERVLRQHVRGVPCAI